MLLRKDIDYEVELDSKTIKTLDKFKWIFRIWFGYKGIIKMKVKKVE